MRVTTEGTARFCARAAYLIFGLLCLALARFVLATGWRESWKMPVMALLGLALGLPVLWGLGWLERRLEERGKLWVLVAGLLIFCAAVKTAGVVLLQVTPEGDYEVFDAVAKAIAQGEGVEGKRYLALFPHILGYAWTLGQVMKVFGAGAMVAPWFNVALSVGSCALLYVLLRRTVSPRAGVTAMALWAVLPSQTIFNSFALSEPLYTFLLMAVFCLLTALKDVKTPGGAAALGAAAGGVLAYFNLCRPVGAVMLTALALFLGLVRMDGWRDRARRTGALVFALVLAAVYAAVGTAAYAAQEAALGEAPARAPGYNVLVGFNRESTGTWNAEDSALLYAYSDQSGSTAVWVQEQMLEQAKARIAGQELSTLPGFFRDKLYVLMGDDAAPVAYGAEKIAHPFGLRWVCNAFYLLLLVGSAAGAALCIRRGERSALFFPMVYLLGLVCAQMLVEVAGRYHYSALTSLTVMAAVGVEGLWSLIARQKKEK